MRFVRAEEITLPLRFIILTAHFVIILAILFDVNNTASNLSYPPTNPNIAGDTNTITGMSYAAIACCGVEYITLFMGVSIFVRALMALNIVLHFCGLILLILFYVNFWNLASFIAFIVVFSFLPVTIELLVLAFMSRFTYVRY